MKRRFWARPACRIRRAAGWPQAAVYAALWITGVLLVRSWARRTGWTERHVLALATGALATYAWNSFPEEPLVEASTASI